MSSSGGSRERILKRIQLATQSISVDPAHLEHRYAAISREYTRLGSMTTAGACALLIERLREYDADVVECLLEDLENEIQKRLAASGIHRIAAPPGLPAKWIVPGFDWKLDTELSHPEIEQAGGVVTAAFCAVADSGTIVLHHSTCEGRRALTLLPDWHLCILFASQIVETLPEYFARCQRTSSLITWISGPSATADIEMTRIKGVHGPRYLNVILVRDDR